MKLEKLRDGVYSRTSFRGLIAFQGTFRHFSLSTLVQLCNFPMVVCPPQLILPPILLSATCGDHSTLSKILSTNSTRTPTLHVIQLMAEGNNLTERQNHLFYSLLDGQSKLVTRMIHSGLKYTIQHFTGSNNNRAPRRLTDDGCKEIICFYHLHESSTTASLIEISHF